MTERNYGDHPELETLAAHTAGQLSAEAAAEVERHLDACWRCRLEMKRLTRFKNIDADEELAGEAAWAQAELVLQRSYRQKVRPATQKSGRTLPRWAWLVPVAAAAVLILLIMPGRQVEIQRNLADDIMRGRTATLLYPVAPVGEVEAPPVMFKWRAEQDLDTYRLEVFTPALVLVFSRHDLKQTSFTVPDSLRASFVRGETYLWSVTGLEGLEAVAATDNAWFTILDE